MFLKDLICVFKFIKYHNKNKKSTRLRVQKAVIQLLPHTVSGLGPLGFQPFAIVGNFLFLK